MGLPVGPPDGPPDGPPVGLSMVEIIYSVIWYSKQFITNTAMVLIINVLQNIYT